MRKKNPNRTSLMSIVLIVGVAAVVFMLSSKLGSNADNVPEPLDYSEFLTIDTYYPKTPEEVIKLNNKLLEMLYSARATDKDIETIISIQRKLFSDELTSLNPEETQASLAKMEVRNFVEDNKKILEFKVEQSILDDRDFNYCTINVSQFTNDNTGINVLYSLKRENGRWKILSWEDRGLI